jgi:NAD(P)H dehydrogenase (quinone)
MPIIAVTGATGRLGRLAVEELLARGVAAGDIVAVVRTPARADDLAARGVQVRHGDYDRPDTLATALTGVDRLLLISGTDLDRRAGQHAAVIDAARAAGVHRIGYTSVLRADSTGNPLAPEHVATERALRDSDVPFTVLRTSWYTEVYTERLGEFLHAGEIVGAAGTGRIAASTRADYAAAAITALLQDTNSDTIYELGGPSFTLDELAATITEVTGRPVVYRNLPADEYAATLAGAGLDPALAGMLAAIDTSIAAGELDTDSATLTRLAGNAPTRLADAVRAAAHELAAHPVTVPH